MALGLRVGKNLGGMGCGKQNVCPSHGFYLDVTRFSDFVQVKLKTCNSLNISAFLCWQLIQYFLMIAQAQHIACEGHLWLYWSLIARVL